MLSIQGRITNVLIYFYHFSNIATINSNGRKVVIKLTKGKPPIVTALEHKCRYYFDA